MVLHVQQPLPFALPGPSSAAVSSYEDTGRIYDWSIGGVPFLSAASREDPLVLRSAEFRKQQVDQSPEPGEQSLTGWWARSQLSFHGGAGMKYSDPALDESASIRFEDSRGVDVWTPGQVTLLPAASKVASLGSGTIVMVGARVLGSDLIVYGNGTTVGYVTASGTTGTLDVTSGDPPASAWQSITSDGTCIYLSNAEGIWKVRWTGFPSSYEYLQAWDFGTLTTATTVLGWAMGRLIAGVDEALYELVPTGGALPDSLPESAVYTSLVPGWRWTSITAGPEAIYAAGYAGNRGSILAVAPAEEGALPTLTGAIEVAQLPTGETPRAIRSYLGTLMAIGTNRGVRVADIEAGGALSYGPLIETELPVSDMASSDRFVYVARSSGSEGAGLLRLDLSVLNELSGRYAYAVDMQAEATGTTSAVALIGETGRVAFAVDGDGIHFQHPTDLVESGWVRTAATRYNTLWPKLFKRLSVRAQIQGSIIVESVDRSGTATTIAALADSTDLSEDLAINVPDTPQEQLALRLTLYRATPTTGPTLRGYILKALPGGPRQYEYLLPLSCYDFEKTQDGQEIGYVGHAWERLGQVMELAKQGAVVMAKELNINFSVLVTIENVEFRQTAPGRTPDSPWGGVLILTLRTLE